VGIRSTKLTKLEYCIAALCDLCVNPLRPLWLKISFWGHLKRAFTNLYNHLDE
jgi:hypothetical protein